ncbi:MAG: 50S ribosomal protein L13 [archaeon]|nr:50S ribosomal protein L13 [archaeon]
MTVIEGTNMVCGRLASPIAKRLLNGERIEIVNAEKIVFTGTREGIFEKIVRRREGSVKGNPHQGPKYPRVPDLLVKRVVRGMLPWKMSSGKAAYKNLRVHIGVPVELKDAKIERIEGAANKLEKGFLTVGEISRSLGAKW